jgi:hypothetical protein
VQSGISQQLLDHLVHHVAPRKLPSPAALRAALGHLEGLRTIHESVLGRAGAADLDRGRRRPDPAITQGL